MSLAVVAAEDGHVGPGAAFAVDDAQHVGHHAINWSAPERTCACRRSSQPQRQVQAQLQTLFALPNLWMVRRTLLQECGDECDCKRAVGLQNEVQSVL
jgi:hypothetical protein